MEPFIRELDKARIVSIDYNNPDLPEAVRQLKPVVYADTPEKDAFCCILGEDPQEGIFGCGPTPLAAMQDWDNHYREQDEGTKV